MANRNVQLYKYIQVGLRCCFQMFPRHIRAPLLPGFTVCERGPAG
jgi:hypothetical protein